MGHSFHIAAQLGGDVTAVFNRIEDAVVQSDEVDGKYLQFEGGLSITGIYICYCIGNIALKLTRCCIKKILYSIGQVGLNRQNYYSTNVNKNLNFVQAW